jgi:integrase
MPKVDRHALHFGPYAAPKVRIGATVKDAIRGPIVVAGLSKAPIAWPHGARPPGGKPGLIVYGDLLRALKIESTTAIRHHWGVADSTIWRWRVALGIDPHTPGSRELQAAMKRGKRCKPHVVAAMVEGRRRWPSSSFAISTKRSWKRRAAAGRSRLPVCRQRPNCGSERRNARNCASRKHRNPPSPARSRIATAQGNQLEGSNAMASISTDARGNRRIQFVDTDGSRKAVRVGKMPMKDTETIKVRVEALVSAKAANAGLDRQTALWLAEIDVKLVNKLAAVGLCPSRESITLAPFITRYVADRTDVKPATKEIRGQGEKSLLEHFGETRNMRRVTPGDADAYKLALNGKKLAPMTVRKRMQFAKMIFRAAVRRKLIESDPFADVSVKVSMTARWHFITQADTAKLIKACPDVHWRTIVALARYGGLRCPSEVLSLKLTDINWADDRMIVHSPKTEHHPGKASRVVPIFAELKTYLLAAAEAAPKGAIYVVDERFRKSAVGEHGWRNCNLRTTFEKIITRAGLVAWPRLFHNLRSSRQTELSETFPSHVVCAWLGNSEDIARDHYLQVTDEHFQKAAHKQAQQASGSTRTNAHAEKQTA